MSLYDALDQLLFTIYGIPAKHLHNVLKRMLRIYKYKYIYEKDIDIKKTQNGSCFYSDIRKCLKKA